MTQAFTDFEIQKERVDFMPTREAGLDRLERFVTRTGNYYARTRNFDFGNDRRSNVSALSPWLRHRLITEEEVLTRVLARHNAADADKFIQEVFWRGYFKGWLEQRPSVWISYQRDLVSAIESLERDTAENARYRDAIDGNTGIDCFDHWARELVATGYLHNHARMWMASIWVFTLRLPWQLGADFFMRHLLDGDPASNTLSWRWVAGLHTRGKTYLARPDNIAKYTEGRFQPKGLAKTAEALVEAIDHPRVAIREPERKTFENSILLLTEDDLSGAELMPSAPVAAIGLLANHGRSPGPLSKMTQSFSHGAMEDALLPFGSKPETGNDWGELLLNAAERSGVRVITTAYCPTGPSRARLDRAVPKLQSAGVTLQRIMRPYDRLTWPHAKAGFFGLKKKIPSILQNLNLPHDSGGIS